MNHLRPLWLAALLALCLTPLAASALGHHQSGVVGQTALGQTCDLSGCVPNPMPMRLFFYDERGRYVTDVTSDADGFFEVPLKPGLYAIIPYFVSLSPEGHFAPVPVIVEKKEYTTVWLHYVPLVQPTPTPRPPSLPPPPPIPMPH